MKRILLMLAGVASLTVYVVPDSHAAEHLRRDVGPNSNPVYQKECGGCHFAYQAGWLPERSWRTLMASLDKHYGESVALPSGARDAILGHLVANSADQRQSLRSVQVIASLKANETPTAVSKVPYVSGIHAGFLDPAFDPKPRVASLANCSTCHTKAEAGSFSAVQYTVSDEAFRSNQAGYAHVLSTEEKLALRKK